MRERCEIGSVAGDVAHGFGTVSTMILAVLTFNRAGDLAPAQKKKALSGMPMSQRRAPRKGFLVNRYDMASTCHLR